MSGIEQIRQELQLKYLRLMLHGLLMIHAHGNNCNAGEHAGTHFNIPFLQN